jgi:hypothetical protein
VGFEHVTGLSLYSIPVISNFFPEVILIYHVWFGKGRTENLAGEPMPKLVKKNGE